MLVSFKEEQNYKKEAVTKSLNQKRNGSLENYRSVLLKARF